MISVAEARARVRAAFRPTPPETIPIGEAAGRVLVEDARAKYDQPPFPVSAMDGYAVRAADAARIPATLQVIGSAPAGHPFQGRVNAGEAVRIFTGGVVPEGADAIVIQEDTEIAADNVTVKQAAKPARHIRKAGLDFRKGDVLVAAGTRLSARDLPLLAAGDLANVAVRMKPAVSMAATGDELSRPGETRKPGGIVASSGYGLSALIRAWGGEPRDLGILPDTVEAISGIAAASRGADLIVTLGGASVGEHDLIQKALGPKGFALDFWKIAMRPGKPLIFGRLRDTPLIGLPGNPVSSLVCSLLFVKPAIEAMLDIAPRDDTAFARLAGELPANDTRQDYIRAKTAIRDGELWVEPFAVQDSSMLKLLAEASALIVRPPHAQEIHAGERVEILPLE